MGPQRMQETHNSFSGTFPVESGRANPVCSARKQGVKLDPKNSIQFTQPSCLCGCCTVCLHSVTLHCPRPRGITFSHTLTRGQTGSKKLNSICTAIVSVWVLYSVFALGHFALPQTKGYNLQPYFNKGSNWIQKTQFNLHSHRVCVGVVQLYSVFALGHFALPQTKGYNLQPYFNFVFNLSSQHLPNICLCRWYIV